MPRDSVTEHGGRCELACIQCGFGVELPIHADTLPSLSP